MPCAYNLTRREMHYRHESFSAGMRAVGYDVRTGVPGQVAAGDVLLIWNRYAHFHDIATRFEAAGGTVIVAENGYLGRDEHGAQRYALALHAHNGAGQWSVGGPERFDALRVDVRPWRRTGNHVLVAPNRSFGMPGMIMPPDWANEVRRRLAKLTNREIRLRPHPGNHAPSTPLADDLKDAWAVVIWSSSAGVHALVAGIPVICMAPHWICEGAADRHLECVEKVDDRGGLRAREEALQRLAWAQWTLAEIESGAAFRHLLGPACR